MGDIQPFNAAIKQYLLTESEYRGLKNELMLARREFVKITGVNRRSNDLKRLQEIEQKIYSIESKLARADIIYDDEEDSYKGALYGVFAELCLTLMGVYLKLTYKLKSYKQGIVGHKATHHIKR